MHTYNGYMNTDALTPDHSTTILGAIEKQKHEPRNTTESIVVELLQYTDIMHYSTGRTDQIKSDQKAQHKYTGVSAPRTRTFYYVPSIHLARGQCSCPPLVCENCCSTCTHGTLQRRGCCILRRVRNPEDLNIAELYPTCALSLPPHTPYLRFATFTMP